jgi:hypothetical protein
MSSLATAQRIEMWPIEKDIKEGPSQIGDSALLGDKEAVTFRIAERYLGVTARQRQKLIVKGALEVLGRGNRRLITTKSLREFATERVN